MSLKLHDCHSGCPRPPDLSALELSCVLGLFGRAHLTASVSLLSGNAGKTHPAAIGLEHDLTDGCSGLHIGFPHPQKGTKRFNEVVIARLSFLAFSWNGTEQDGALSLQAR